MNINALFVHKHTSALLVLAFVASTQTEFNQGLSEAENEAARSMRQFSTEVETSDGDDAQLESWFASYEAPAPPFQPITREADAWQNDHLQFARLLRELDLAGAFTPAMLARLTESMDCEEKAIDQLIGRVTAAYDDYQARAREPQTGYQVTLRLSVSAAEAPTPYAAAAYAQGLLHDAAAALAFEVRELGSGEAVMVSLDGPPDNRWKLVDSSGDPYRAYEEQPDFFTDEATARATFKTLATAGKPVRLYSCYDDGNDLTEWDLQEEENWPEEGEENAAD